jgi:hypothetical protein
MLSACHFVSTDSTSLPADEQVALTARLHGREVRVSFTLGLETPGLVGFHLWRLVGSSRVQVDEDMVRATGIDGTTYTVVDELPTAARGLRRASAVQYELELVHADEPSTVRGPFDLVAPSGERVSRR